MVISVVAKRILHIQHLWYHNINRWELLKLDKAHYKKPAANILIVDK